MEGKFVQKCKNHIWSGLASASLSLRYLQWTLLFGGRFSDLVANYYLRAYLSIRERDADVSWHGISNATVSWNMTHILVCPMSIVLCVVGDVLADFIFIQIVECRRHYRAANIWVRMLH